MPLSRKDTESSWVYERGFGHNRRQILTQEFTQKYLTTMQCESEKNQNVGHKLFHCAREITRVMLMTAFYISNGEGKTQVCG